MGYHHQNPSEARCLLAAVELAGVVPGFAVGVAGFAVVVLDLLRAV